MWRRKQRSNYLRRGFTLVEVLMVIAIVGILFALTADIYGIAIARSHDQERLSDLDTINNALEQYHLDNKSYPKEGLTTNNLVVAKYQLEPIEGCGVSGPSGKGYLAPSYIPTIPDDPQYRLSISGTSTDCNTNQFGQYLYVTNVASTTATVQAYYLMARMERTQFMSPAGTVSSLQSSAFASSYWGAIIFNPASNLIFCDQSNGTAQQATCTHNYYKTNITN